MTKRKVFVTNIEWADPPETTTRRHAGHIERFVEAIKDHPRRWAVYDRHAAAGNIGHHRYRHPGTEWTSRANGDGTHTVYVRWLGDVCSECGQVKVIDKRANGD